MDEYHEWAALAECEVKLKFKKLTFWLFSVVDVIKLFLKEI